MKDLIKFSSPFRFTATLSTTGAGSYYLDSPDRLRFSECGRKWCWGGGEGFICPENRVWRVEGLITSLRTPTLLDHIYSPHSACFFQPILPSFQYPEESVDTFVSYFRTSGFCRFVHRGVAFTGVVNNTTNQQIIQPVVFPQVSERYFDQRQPQHNSNLGKP